ncbi:hypothetical protein MADA3029_300041 [Vibrio nigripulchritudo MADA3029]|nr:hypothetical protein VIBNIAM115_1050041 [Vibrio nigripulchritudo AM115]CCN40401.1 hypothetical protein VIBNIFTn2_1240051 [Vibrio nigripulchritudo FTn2]CCN58965.1 hypothetical protein MADA3029_300041 [Vibrio nigripulchritudo MADA3029]CCN65282.1 hypothetical protein VIBNIPon4_370037 [Vibrio nigripulchritudo POn4]CCN77257.1 hypothetical protein VIBNISO65_220037 [Vibrio nigripulchritudo SO65]
MELSAYKHTEITRNLDFNTTYLLFISVRRPYLPYSICLN